MKAVENKTQKWSRFTVMVQLFLPALQAVHTKRRIRAVTLRHRFLVPCHAVVPAAAQFPTDRRVAIPSPCLLPRRIRMTPSTRHAIRHFTAHAKIRRIRGDEEIRGQPVGFSSSLTRAPPIGELQGVRISERRPAFCDIHEIGDAVGEVGRLLLCAAIESVDGPGGVLEGQQGGVTGAHRAGARHAVAFADPSA